MSLGVGEVFRATAVPRNASKHRVRESGNASSAFRLSEIDRLGHTSVRGNSTHIQNLVEADPKRVQDASLYALETPLHSSIEKVIEPASEALNAEHQLSAPGAITSVE